MTRYSIDTDLGIDYADVPPWRSYELTSDGDTLLELLENATIAEIDQDGGELACYGLGENSEVDRAAHKVIENYLISFYKTQK